MTATTSYPNAPDVSPDDYLVLGLATCYLREEGETHEVQIVEPIPSAALEAILKGVPTSYQWAIATTIGKVIDGTTATKPADFPAEAQFCDDFGERAIATVRTYKKKPEAQSHIPVGTQYEDLNFSTDRKRILNSERIVKAEDNVKQHAYTHEVL